MDEEPEGRIPLFVAVVIGVLVVVTFITCAAAFMGSNGAVV